MLVRGSALCRASFSLCPLAGNCLYSSLYKLKYSYMEKEIKNWLQGSRDYYEGVTLYNKYGHNRVLKQRFSSKGSTTQALLLTELCKLANITEDQAQRLPRKAKISAIKEEPKTIHPDDIVFELMRQLGVSSVDLESETVPEFLTDRSEDIQEAYKSAKNTYVEFPDTIRKTIKLREEFPFLNEDSCPDELKLLVHDMFTEYDKYRLAHKKLTEAPENTEIEQLFTDAQTSVESYLSNRLIWEELNHYKEHGAVLGVHPKLEGYFYKKEISELDDASLAQKRLNARSSVSKTKKTYENNPNEESQDAFNRWTAKLDIIEKELDKRKK